MRSVINNKFGLILMIAVIPAVLHADITLYLYPRVKLNETLRLRDIAKIEAGAAVRDEIEELEIAKSIFPDGLIEKEALLKLLAAHTDEPVFIYGNGVKVYEEAGAAKKEPQVIKTGDSITLSAEKNGVRISMRGIVVQDGKVGEVVPVKVKNSKLIKGKIVSGREIILDI